MSFAVPHRYEIQIEQVAEAQHITTDEALDRIIQAGLERFVPVTKPPSVSYTSLFAQQKMAMDRVKP